VKASAPRAASTVRNDRRIGVDCGNPSLVLPHSIFEDDVWKTSHIVAEGLWTLANTGQYASLSSVPVI
jgi:hypothetical protein